MARGLNYRRIFRWLTIVHFHFNVRVIWVDGCLELLISHIKHQRNRRDINSILIEVYVSVRLLIALAQYYTSTTSCLYMQFQICFELDQYDNRILLQCRRNFKIEIPFYTTQ